MSINFEGRVAIVTGAANGLGKSHALSLAKLGAKVVVNDFGGARDEVGDDGVNIPRVNTVGFQLPEREGRSQRVSRDDAAQRTLVKIIAAGLQKTLEAGFRSRVRGGHQNDPAGIRAPH